jgi:hypothetical protein
MHNNKLVNTADPIAAAQTIADYLACTVISESPLERTSYNHMGATLTDTVLQAGLNYRSVVLPRVRYVLVAYPEAVTTTSFWKIMCEVGAYTLLRWSHPEKIDRLNGLVGLLRKNSIETESELAEWLSSTTANENLLSLRGIGPKTVDYLKILVGIPTVAVDRHIKTLFRLLGLEFSEYDDLKSVLCHAAGILRVQPHVLDGIIWQHLSTKARSENPSN